MRINAIWKYREDDQQFFNKRVRKEREISSPSEIGFRLCWLSGTRFRITSRELRWNVYDLRGSGRRAGENNHVEIDPCIYRYRGFNCRKKQFFFFPRSYRNNLNSAWKKINAVLSSVYYERIVFLTHGFRTLSRSAKYEHGDAVRRVHDGTRLLRGGGGEGGIIWIWNLNRDEGERYGTLRKMGGTINRRSLWRSYRRAQFSMLFLSSSFHVFFFLLFVHGACVCMRVYVTSL